MRFTTLTNGARERIRADLVCGLVVRGLGLTYLLAFASLWVQLDGLVGSQGIEPAAELLAAAHERLGGAAYLRLPTWLWLNSSDAALHVVCAFGAACSLAVLAARFSRTALALAWSCYLSLASVGNLFLSYQWDALLLESGLVGLFVATPGSRVGVWLARALVWKLMFLSGVVKLSSGDPTWRDLSALSFHWWTQPLPTWTAWLAAQLPLGLQRAATFAAVAIEVGAPFAIFAPRRARLIGAALLVLLQLAIAATGNYGFFNLLALVLCASLLDDAALLALCPSRLRRRAVARDDPPQRVAGPRRAVLIGFSALLLAASALAGVQRVWPSRRLPLLGSVVAALAPLRSTNAYGLFAVMTTDRTEIAIEGSADGREWRAYAFPWKPGDPARRPDFATPHMPRLDWQMWFAAFGDCRSESWLHALLFRLLEGSAPVAGLFESNPFPAAPPRYLRTPTAQYRFAPPGSDAWWVAEPTGDFCPPVTLRDGHLAIADDLPSTPHS